ncbi:hypothetical protein CWE22_01855 [Pseudidiomarina aestuarii]|uniref:Chalcone isomerase domain-containing protein n=1 Tax=Pseudidiomarina aestuarii TaxID=624146 RepID=A0A7Z6ZTH7_9GAMM|nr:chalcone isomerase family protein [Pseudidiomarina aestuarii]RUO40967.1 hypothetical protein CWE22_01855 [Pseudidiomarina aestuarii]
MKRQKRLSWFVAASVIGLSSVTFSAQGACVNDQFESLEVVGETRLSVLFWDVYDAQLRTDSGNYDSYDQRALRLTYLREIKATELVESTQEEWERLGIEITENHQTWLQELNQMWPDVKKGTCLMMIEDADGFAQFHSADGQLGTIQSATFTDDFLAIWLDENSRFKDERNELIGAGS